MNKPEQHCKEVKFSLFTMANQTPFFHTLVTLYCCWLCTMGTPLHIFINYSLKYQCIKGSTVRNKNNNHLKVVFLSITLISINSLLLSVFPKGSADSTSYEEIWLDDSFLKTDQSPFKFCSRDAPFFQTVPDGRWNKSHGYMKHLGGLFFQLLKTPLQHITGVKSSFRHFRDRWWRGDLKPGCIMTLLSH